MGQYGTEDGRLSGALCSTGTPTAFPTTVARLRKSGLIPAQRRGLAYSAAYLRHARRAVELFGAAHHTYDVTEHDGTVVERDRKLGVALALAVEGYPVLASDVRLDVQAFTTIDKQAAHSRDGVTAERRLMSTFSADGISQIKADENKSVRAYVDDVSNNLRSVFPALSVETEDDGMFPLSDAERFSDIRQEALVAIGSLAIDEIDIDEINPRLVVLANDPFASDDEIALIGNSVERGDYTAQTLSDVATIHDVSTIVEWMRRVAIINRFMQIPHAAVSHPAPNNAISETRDALMSALFWLGIPADESISLLIAESNLAPVVMAHEWDSRYLQIEHS